MLIIIHNEPLLFVQGPPVFIKVVVEQEESTSVFVLGGEVPELESEVNLQQAEDHEDDKERNQEQNHGDANAVKVVDSSLVRKITYLSSPFSRQVYRPLEFVLNGEEEIVKGTIEKVDGETLVIEMSDGDKEFVSVEIGRIEEILWRGDPFVED